MMNFSFAKSISLLVPFVDPVLRAMLLATAAGLALITFRVKSISLRLYTWTAVLYAALAMPMLSWVLPPMNVPIPSFLDQAAIARQVAPLSITDTHFSQSTGGLNAARSSAPSAIHSLAATKNIAASPQQVGHSARFSIQWSSITIGIYGAVTLFLLARLIVGILFSRRLLHAARPIQDQRLDVRLASRAYACGIRTIPRIAVSDLISVPMTLGVVRPTILLPANWDEWDDAKLNSVLAHEVSHVARRDALTQRLSLLHRAVFWFSPLAWWLNRHLAELAEQASDEAVLACGADRNDYAKTLLGFFEALHAAQGRVWWQGVAMAKAGQAEQRLERIFAWRGAVIMPLKNRNLKRSMFVAILVLSLPIVYLAASARPASSGVQDTQSPVPPPSAGVLPAPSAPVSALAPPAIESLAHASTPASPAIAPVTPVAAIAPTAPWIVQAHSYSGHNYSYRYGDDDEQRFVIVTGKSDELTMSGSAEDAHHAEKLKKQIPGDFIWFERDEKSYIIRDQATIDRARQLWAPQEELGKKQEELGKQQEALGKQQEELGKKMEQVQVKVPDMTAELDRLKSKLQKLGPNASMEQLGDLQSEIGELQSKIGDIQSQAGEQQSKLGEQMGALGEQQGKLGEEQGKLGEQQGELAEKASRQMKELLDEAIKNGKAQPEPQTGGTGML